MLLLDNLLNKLQLSFSLKVPFQGKYLLNQHFHEIQEPFEQKIIYIRFSNITKIIINCIIINNIMR